MYAFMYVCMYVDVSVLYGHMHRDIALPLSVTFQEPLMFIIAPKNDHFRKVMRKGQRCYINIQIHMSTHVTLVEKTDHLLGLDLLTFSTSLNLEEIRQIFLAPKFMHFYENTKHNLVRNCT